LDNFVFIEDDNFENINDFLKGKFSFILIDPSQISVKVLKSLMRLATMLARKKNEIHGDGKILINTLGDNEKIMFSNGYQKVNFVPSLPNILFH
jgi:hypothetical protein